MLRESQTSAGSVSPPRGRSVAFLRAINVAGRRVRSEELVAAFTSLGLTKVQTFLASGNVLYRPSPELADAEMSAMLGERLGFAVDVTSRTTDELAIVATAGPFSTEDVGSSKSGLQVMLLFEPVTDAMRMAVGSVPTDDHFAFGARELFWLPTAGVADSDLREIHKAVGRNTIRSARTIERLMAKL
jgi:uncharacterized protein (DUF1697 family)